MSMDVSELLSDPGLPEKLTVLQSFWETERAARARFYDEVTEEEHVEFINGEIIRHSPTASRELSVEQNLRSLLGTFGQIHALGSAYGGKALCAFPRNDYAPDVTFFCSEKAAQIETETFKFPIPDFACEVLSDSTEHRDRGVKFRDYAAHGVGEYWIIDPERELLEQYLPREGRYELTLKSGSGEVASAVVPGLRIPIRALFDEAENLRVLRTLLA